MLPALPIHYIADSAYFPYGERAPEEVEARSLALTRQLIAQGCDLVVVACNTASSAALERLREQFEVPIVGMEPPLKPAAERTRSGRIAVLATPATARGERLARLQHAYSGGADVIIVPSPGLADLVEAGEVAGERVEQALHRAFDPLSGDGGQPVDEVALGCTHYGFLRSSIEALLGPGVEVIDAAEPVARRVKSQLEAFGATIPSGAEVMVQCATTGDPGALEATVTRLRGAQADLPPMAFVRAAVPA